MDHPAVHCNGFGQNAPEKLRTLRRLQSGYTAGGERKIDGFGEVEGHGGLVTGICAYLRLE